MTTAKFYGMNMVRLKSSTLQKFSQLKSRISTSNPQCFFFIRHSSDSSRYQERQQLLGNFLNYVALDLCHGIHAVLKSMACKSQWRIQGRGPGGHPPPLIFENNEARSAGKNFFGDRVPPFISGSGRPPPLSEGPDPP